MKKRITFIIVAATFLMGSLAVVLQRENSVSLLGTNNIEVLANCENPDGEDCDGHCVEDNMNKKFCATPGWHKKNCKMGYY